MAGWYIEENIRTMYDLFCVGEEHNIPGLLLSVDFEEAFDSVSHDFLFDVQTFILVCPLKMDTRVL